MTILYHTSCGCILERSQLINGPSSINRRLVCPKHRGIVEAKSRKCNECGAQILYKKPSGRLPPLCEKCNPKKKTPTKATVEVQANFELLMERSDCICRPLCLEVHFRDETLPCAGCTDYCPKDPLVDMRYRIDLIELDEVISKINLIGSENNNTTLEAKALLRWGKIYEKRKKDLLGTELQRTG